MLATIMAAAAPAAAAPPVRLEYELGIVSDYRFRGLSLSDRKPALQAGVTAAFAGGGYIGAWGSTIDEYASSGDEHGATVELDLSAGWAFSAGGLDLDLGVAAYTYPRAQDLAYIEIPASVSRSVGRATLSLGGAYAPSQSALGHRDNTYVYAAAAWAAGPFDLDVRSGYEHGAFAPRGKWDWSATVGRAFGPIRAELSYVDTDEPDVAGGVVAAVRLGF